jgi:nucleotide-binding universal stress UspA family protein
MWAAINVLGPRIGKRALAVVVPFEGKLSGTSAARHVIEAAADVSSAPTTIQLTGDPADQLANLVERDCYDLLVVGTRGKGLSPTLLVSVARKRLQLAPVPLLVVNQLAAKAAKNDFAEIPRRKGPEP